MKSFVKKDFILKSREVALKKNLSKRKKNQKNKKKKNDSTFR